MIPLENLQFEGEPWDSTETYHWGPNLWLKEVLVTITADGVGHYFGAHQDIIRFEGEPPLPTLQFTPLHRGATVKVVFEHATVLEVEGKWFILFLPTNRPNRVRCMTYAEYANLSQMDAFFNFER